MAGAGAYTNRVKERDIEWGAVLFGSAVAVAAGVLVAAASRGVYNPVVESPVEREDTVAAAVGLIVLGDDWLPAAPVGFGGIAGGAFLAGLVPLAVNVLAG